MARKTTRRWIARLLLAAAMLAFAGVSALAEGVAPENTPYIPTPEPTHAPATITITAVGDCTLGTYRTGSGRNSKFGSYVEKYGYDYFFENVRSLFEQDDITIVNLEGPLTNSKDKRSGRTFNFRGKPEWAQILSGSSVEICNVANNHVLDYKQAGADDTVAALQAVGVGASGYGLEYYTEVKGITIGSLGFTEWNFEPEDILKSVETARQKCDLLIVSMHWNEEGKRKMSAYCKQMGMALVDAGADIVIGNHTHFPGEIMQYKGKYIIGSLGNFCFGGNDVIRHFACVIFRQRFTVYGDGTVTDEGIDIIPAYITSDLDKNNYQPMIADVESGVKLLNEVAGYSETLTIGNVKWMEDSYAVQNHLVAN